MTTVDRLPDYIRSPFALRSSRNEALPKHLLAGSIDTTPASSFEAWQICLQEISEIGELGEDWNGYGAHAISRASLDAARAACLEFREANLPAPEVSPKANGTIGLSWEFFDSEAYLEIGNTTYSGFLSLGSFEPALFHGSVDDIAPELLFPLLQDRNAVSGPGYTIADIRITTEFAYGFAA